MPFVLPFAVLLYCCKVLWDLLPTSHGNLWGLLAIVAALTVATGIVMVFAFIDASVERTFHRGRRF